MSLTSNLYTNGFYHENESHEIFFPVFIDFKVSHALLHRCAHAITRKNRDKPKKITKKKWRRKNKGVKYNLYKRKSCLARSFIRIRIHENFPMISLLLVIVIHETDFNLSILHSDILMVLFLFRKLINYPSYFIIVSFVFCIYNLVREWTRAFWKTLYIFTTTQMMSKDRFALFNKRDRHLSCAEWIKLKCKIKFWIQWRRHNARAT